MGRKDKQISYKEYYQLWWEYLKRSDKYKYFCDNYGELEEDHFGASYEIFSHYMKFFGDVFKIDTAKDWWETPRRRNGRLPRSRPVLDLRDQESYSSSYFKALTNKDNSSRSFPSQKRFWK
jgi:hypothetical protein